MSLYQFYRSDQWQKFREVVINERTQSDGFIYDEVTNKPILKKYDIILHHKIHLTEENYTDANISLNPDNIMVVAHKTHNKIHNKLGYAHREVYLVYGSPLSGKSSYVNSVLSEGDLVIDMDNIWECVSGQSRYVKPNRLKSVVFSVRDNLLESVQYRRGKWSNCYIIGGYPYEAERNRLLDKLGAKPIHIDTPKSVCLDRLTKCEDRDIDEWTEYINNWWLQYEGGY